MDPYSPHAGFAADAVAVLLLFTAAVFGWLAVADLFVRIPGPRELFAWLVPDPVELQDEARSCAACQQESQL
jgi:hypothetical protein